MKKKLVLLMVLALVALAFAGCGGGATEPKPEPEITGAVKTGLSVVTTIARSTDATADKAGVAQGYSDIVAVTVDENGVITNCVIDSLQSNVNFDATGKVTTPLDAVFFGKLERGDDYGMKKASSIDKEWHEQADFLSSYVIGMTADEVMAIGLSDGYPTDADLTSSVTMHIDVYLEGIVEAMENAVDMGASADDKLGIGTYSTIARSKDAAADTDGNVEIYAHFAAVTFNANGVITSAILDSSQANVTFDKAGIIKTDLSTVYPGKNVLGDSYGMKKASSIGKEWYEQAAYFAEYVLGMTASEVEGIALADGYPSDADLSSGATMHVDMFVTNITKAYQFAK
jgi:hypothetical protein